MLWCCIEPERVEKTTPIMQAMARGFGGRTCLGDPPDDGEMVVVWGQLWTALRVIPQAIRQGRPFLHIDNGYIRPAKGTLTGYYRITYNGMSPVFLPGAPKARLRLHMESWRAQGRHVIIALPGENFGRALGLNMMHWIMQSQISARPHTRRQIVIRPRKTHKPLASDLQGCWALVTHSSNVAVDAVMNGIPVFVAPTSPAAPVGNFDLAKLEHPDLPDRRPWFNSLIAQQYTIDEMRSGLAREYLQMVMDRKSQAA